MMIDQASYALLQLLITEALFAALLAAAVWPLVRLLGRRAPRLRHALWALVLLRLVLPVDLALPLSARSLAERGIGLVRGAWIDPAPALAAAEHASPVPRLATAETAARERPWAPLVAATWLTGAGGLMLLFAQRRSRYRRLARHARPVDDPAVLALAERWRRALRVRRRVRLLSAEASCSAFTFGLLRPVIFLPAAALAPRRHDLLTSAIGHEMAHVRRLDDLWLIAQHLIQALYFFHPVAWLAGRRLDEERERLCDRMVLAQGTVAPRAYAASLLAMLELNREGGAPMAAFGDPKRRFAMRIREIVEAPRPSRALFSYLAALAVALFLLPMAAADPPTAATAASPVLADGPALANPLPGGRVTSSFGKRPNPWTQKLQKHSGIDVHADPGARVLAPADGRVEVATERYEGGERHGTVIVVDHGEGWKTFYSHLESLAVAAGDRVRAGQALGVAGTTGQVTGRHLHFEVWHRGTPVDPASLVADWRRSD